VRCLAVLLLAAAGIGASEADVASQIRSAQAAGDYDRAAKLYGQLIASGEDTPEIRSNCGIMLHLAGKNVAALVQFHDALRRNPALVSANLFGGEAEFAAGHPRQALPLLEKARALAPGDPAPLLALGKVQTSLRDFASANQNYSKAAALDPALAEAWYGVGITSRSLADQKLNHAIRAGHSPPEETRALLDQSLAALKRAVELDPNSARSHLIMAESLSDAGKLTDAVPEYQAAIKLDPRMDAAYLGLATTYWKQRQFDDAFPPLKHVLASSPKDPEANGIMADILEHNGEYERARQYAQTALAGNPDLIETHLVLARIDLATSHPDRAVRDLEGVLGADRDGAYHYLLYRAYKQLGKDQEANAAFREFQERRKLGAEK
jgi:tetratricopeptide (TPR) repeat protein